MFKHTKTMADKRQVEVITCGNGYMDRVGILPKKASSYEEALEMAGVAEEDTLKISGDDKVFNTSNKRTRDVEDWLQQELIVIWCHCTPSS